MAKITGRVEILVNATPVFNKSGATAMGIGKSGEMSFQRNPVLGDTGLHGHTEEPQVAACEFTVTDRDDVMLSDFAQIDGNGTVIFQAAGATGKTYTMDGATCTNNFTLTAGEGETPIRMEGPYWVESVR